MTTAPWPRETETHCWLDHKSACSFCRTIWQSMSKALKPDLTLNPKIPLHPQDALLGDKAGHTQTWPQESSLQQRPRCATACQRINPWGRVYTWGRSGWKNLVDDLGTYLSRVVKYQSPRTWVAVVFHIFLLLEGRFFAKRTLSYSHCILPH